MFNTGYNIKHEVSDKYISPIFFDTYAQYECLMYLFFYGSDKFDRVNKTMVTNANGDCLVITVTNWDFSYKHLFSENFYNSLKEKGYRWMLPTNGLPAVKNPFNKIDNPDMDTETDLFNGMTIGRQLSAVYNSWKSGIEKIPMQIEFMENELFDGVIYEKYKLCDWITTLDMSLDWESIRSQIDSINCRNVSYSNAFVQYSISDNQLVPILYVKASKR